MHPAIPSLELRKGGQCPLSRDENVCCIDATGGANILPKVGGAGKRCLLLLG